MLQDFGVKPADEIRTHPFPRTTTDRLQKINANSDEVLTCPRCDSMNTKFCYYNNYSLSQPRHYCKNCRRYWTKGGALRNVPIGGGCRKNKRIKYRTVDPSSLVSLDETTSNMLANINTGNCTSSLLSNFSGPSSSAFVNLSHECHGYGVSFSPIHEILRLGEQSDPSDQGVYNLGLRSSQLTTELLNASCSQPSPITSLPLFDTNLLSVSFPKSEEGILYNGSDLRSLFETPTTQMVDATTRLASLKGQYLPTCNMQPGESFSGAGIEDHFKLRQKQLAMQLLNDEQSGDRARIGRVFQDENSQEKLGRIKGRGFPSSLGDGRFVSDWQGVPDTLFETTGESSVWANSGWIDLHMLSSGTAVSTL